jgi:hypothetical protein
VAEGAAITYARGLLGKNGAGALCLVVVVDINNVKGIYVVLRNTATFKTVQIDVTKTLRTRLRIEPVEIIVYMVER